MKYFEDSSSSFPRISSLNHSSGLHKDAELHHRSLKQTVGVCRANLTWPSGATYVGDVVNGCRSGQGKQSWPDGSAFEGEFFNDLRHGKGKHIWSSGEMYEGEFYKDRRHGEGIYKWPDGSEYHGAFYLGRKEGHGRFIFENGDIFEGLYNKDERCGSGILTYNKSRKQDVGLWFKEKLIRMCSEIDGIFSMSDHPEYPFVSEEHFSQINIREEGEYDDRFVEKEKSFQFGGKDLHAALYSEENFLPNGIEQYSGDFEHLPVTSNLRECLDKSFFKDNYHLVKNDEYAFLFANNNTIQLMDVQKQIYRHRHTADKYNSLLSQIDGTSREAFPSKPGPLEEMSGNLIKAAKEGVGKTVYEILKSGLVNPNVCDHVGNTALLGAAINCHGKIVNLLLDMGGNIDHVNDEGVSALNACHVFYFPCDHFKPNIAEKYINDHSSGKMTLKIQKKGERRGGIFSNKGNGMKLQSPVPSRESSPSNLSETEQHKKDAMECCKSDMRIKARFREISSAKLETRVQLLSQQAENQSNQDETSSIASNDSIQSNSADNSLASKRNLIDFYMDVPEDLIERTATLLSLNRRAVSGISTRDGRAIDLGTAGALAVWKAEHEEMRKMIELLLQRGASPNKSSVPMPPLFFAVKAGDTDAIRLLLMRGASTEARISSSLGGFTPLHIASAIPGKEGVQAVKLILQAGANPNSTAQDEDISHSKNNASDSYKSSSEYSSSLLKKSSSSSSQWLSEGLKSVEEGGRTPLHIACDRDDDYMNACDVVHELLDNGADPDVIWSGHSPLSLAISSGNDCAIEELLKFGADASMPLKRGVGNALCVAANTEYEYRRDADARIKLVDMLVNAGASILAPVIFGTKQVTGTVVDYAHWMFGRDSRIARTPYHALSYQERDTYNARRRLLAHFGNLLREAAVKVEREKLNQETKFGLRSLSPSRNERFLYTGAGAKSVAAPASSLPPSRLSQVPASHVSFPDHTLYDTRSDSNLSSTNNLQEKQIKPVKIIKGRKGSGPIRKPLFRYCYECGRSVGVRLTTCSRCKEVYYCSRSCKLKAWEERHKNECLRQKSNRQLISPSATEVAPYFTIHTLKEAIDNDPMIDSVKILPKSIVRNTEFLPITKSEKPSSAQSKHTKSKTKPRRKTASTTRTTSTFQRLSGKESSRKAQLGKTLQTRVGKEVYFGTTGMTLAELGIEENYSFE